MNELDLVKVAECVESLISGQDINSVLDTLLEASYKVDPKDTTHTGMMGLIKDAMVNKAKHEKERALRFASMAGQSKNGNYAKLMGLAKKASDRSRAAIPR